MPTAPIRENIQTCLSVAADMGSHQPTLSFKSWSVSLSKVCNTIYQTVNNVRNPTFYIKKNAAFIVASTVLYLVNRSSAKPSLSGTAGIASQNTLTAITNNTLPIYNHSNFESLMRAFADDDYEYDDGDFSLEYEDYSDDPDESILSDQLLDDLEITDTSPSDTPKIKQRSKRQASPSRWQSVPSIRNPYGHRFKPSETTVDGNYMRIGINTQNRLQERTSLSKGAVYKFRLGDHRDNTISKMRGSICPPTTVGHLADCKGRIELKSCFIKDADPHLSRTMRNFRIAAHSFENDCDAVIPNGSTFAMAMEVKFTTISKVIIQQLHGMPDSRFYKYGNATYLIPEESSIKLYNAVKDIGGVFEAHGYPPEALAIKLIGGKAYLVLQVRADYAAFTDISKKCNLRFRPSPTRLNHAKCCHGERDVSHVYFGEIGVDLSATGWNKFAIEVMSSTFFGTAPTPGYVRVWNNGIMVANSITYIGRNDSPERGGSGLYNKFGLYRPNSEDPAAVQFRRIRTGKVVTDVDPVLSVTLAPVNVKGTCFPLAAPTTPAVSTVPTTTTMPPITTVPVISNTTPAAIVTPSVKAVSTTRNSTLSPEDSSSTPAYNVTAPVTDDFQDTCKNVLIASLTLNSVLIPAIATLTSLMIKRRQLRHDEQNQKQQHRREEVVIEMQQLQPELGV